MQERLTTRRLTTLTDPGPAAALGKVRESVSE